jgi:predicted ATPase
MAICGGFTKLDALPEGAGWVTVSLVGEDIILQDSNNQHPRRLESELAMGLVYEAMIGVSGVGKSTLSALLAHAGWELLGDDIVAIEINQNVQQTPSLGLLRFPTAISRATHGRYVFVRPYHHS